MSVETLLKNNPYLAELFKNIPEDIKHRCVIKHFPANTIVLKKDAEVKYVYIRYSGTLRVLNEFANGNIYGFAYIDSTDFLGALEILAEASKNACTVETVTDCVALRMSKEDFLKWFEKDIFFATNIAKLLAKKFYPTIYKNGAVFMNSSIHSFIAFLIKFVQKDIQEGKTAFINKKRQYIADELGISLRTVHRIIKKLKEDQLLTVIKGKIYVNQGQYERLVEIVDDCI